MCLAYPHPKLRHCNFLSALFDAVLPEQEFGSFHHRLPRATAAPHPEF